MNTLTSSEQSHHKKHYVPVCYGRTCQYCGKEFIAHDTRKVFCSKKCSDVASKVRRGIKCNTSVEPYHKECVICGKAFDTFRDIVKTCSPECAKVYRSKSKSKETKTIQIKCAICGKIVETSRKSQKTCLADACKKEYSTKQHHERNQKWLEKVRIEKKHYRALHIVERECEECGALFYCLDSENRKTCSTECSKRYRNRKHDKRIPKAQQIDRITLKKLYKRDKGICYLCGGECEWNDWKVSPKGNSYPGDKYPTIEHVVPISKGGLDAWDNVRLAHWKCNLEKADGIIKMQPMTHQFAYSQKFSATQAKKTAQYSLDGELIKIWDSTAQIERELGLRSKHIQNVCRGDNSNTGNAYGFHWEYVS